MMRGRGDTAPASFFGGTRSATSFPFVAARVFLRGARPGRAVLGCEESSPVDTPPGALKPGEFVWAPDVAPEGPIVVVVSLDRAAWIRLSQRCPDRAHDREHRQAGNETPTGIFTILQKDKDHHSSKYKGAKMPYMERLTWDGIAMHAGGLPGYPESAGCVRVPSKFAEDLFAVSTLGRP